MGSQSRSPGRGARELRAPRAHGQPDHFERRSSAAVPVDGQPRDEHHLPPAAGQERRRLPGWAHNRDLLAEGRASFARLGLTDSQIISNGDQALLFPWMGSRVMNTIYLQLQGRSVDVCLDGLTIAVDGRTPDALCGLLRELVAEGPADG